jgi:hypothetical protein
MFYWDPVNAVKAAADECWGDRRVASRTFSLPEFKAAAKQLKVTVNTLAVSCLGGGVRRYLLTQQQPVPQRVRMLVAVDTRALTSMPNAGGNYNGMLKVPANCFIKSVITEIAVPVCTGDVSPAERLSRVNRAIDWIRHSPALMLAVAMPAVAMVRCSSVAAMLAMLCYSYAMPCHVIPLMLAVMSIGSCSASKASFNIALAISSHLPHLKCAPGCCKWL